MTIPNSFSPLSQTPGNMTPLGARDVKEETQPSSRPEIQQKPKPSGGKIFWNEMEATSKIWAQKATDNAVMDAGGGFASLVGLGAGAAIGTLGGAAFMGCFGASVSPAVATFIHSGFKDIMGFIGNTSHIGQILGGIFVGTGGYLLGHPLLSKLAGGLAGGAGAVYGGIKGMGKAIKASTGGDVELTEIPQQKTKEKVKLPDGFVSKTLKQLGGAIGTGSGLVGGAIIGTTTMAGAATAVQLLDAIVTKNINLGGVPHLALMTGGILAALGGTMGMMGGHKIMSAVTETGKKAVNWLFKRNEVNFPAENLKIDEATQELKAKSDELLRKLELDEARLIREEEPSILQRSDALQQKEEGLLAKQAGLSKQIKDDGFSLHLKRDEARLNELKGMEQAKEAKEKKIDADIIEKTNSGTAPLQREWQNKISDAQQTQKGIKAVYDGVKSDHDTAYKTRAVAEQEKNRMQDTLASERNRLSHNQGRYNDAISEQESLRSEIDSLKHQIRNF